MDSANPLFVDVIARFQKALAEKLELDEKKKLVDEQVEDLSEAVRVLHRVYGGELPEPVLKQVEGDLGITDQVREAMKSVIPANAPAGFQVPWWTPVNVRDTVAARGFNLSDYSNPMAVIHQVLKRLAKQGEIEVHPGGQHYRWKRK